MMTSRRWTPSGVIRSACDAEMVSHDDAGKVRAAKTRLQEAQETRAKDAADDLGTTSEE